MNGQIKRIFSKNKTWLNSLILCCLLVGFFGCSKGGIETTQLTDGEIIELHFSSVGETTIYDDAQNLMKRWTPQNGEIISFKNIAPASSNPVLDGLIRKVVAYYRTDLERSDVENRNIMIPLTYDPDFKFGGLTDVEFSNIQDNYKNNAKVVNAADNKPAAVIFIKGEFLKARRIGPNGEEGQFYDKATLEQRVTDKKNTDFAAEMGAPLQFKIVLPEQDQPVPSGPPKQDVPPPAAPNAPAANAAVPSSGGGCSLNSATSSAPYGLVAWLMGSSLLIFRILAFAKARK